MSQHTPGPWQADRGGSKWHRPFGVWALPIWKYEDWSGTPVAWVHPYNYGNLGDVHADARLIAKAPEMLTMLQELRTVLRDAAYSLPLDYWNEGGDGYDALMRLCALLREIEEKPQD